MLRGLVMLEAQEHDVAGLVWPAGALRVNVVMAQRVAPPAVPTPMTIALVNNRVDQALAVQFSAPALLPFRLERPPGGLRCEHGDKSGRAQPYSRVRP